MADGFIWRPTPELVEQANVTRLARALGAADYHALHRISVEEPERFWPALIADLRIEFSRPWDTVVDASRGPEWATWFAGGRVNAARVSLHRWAAERPDEEALVGLYEDGRREALTWAEASRAVTQLAEALVELGVREGDRVGIFMPMCPAVAIASHACAHVGAVQVPIFSGFAAPAIASRQRQPARCGPHGTSAASRAHAPAHRCRSHRDTRRVRLATGCGSPACFRDWRDKRAPSGRRRQHHLRRRRHRTR